MLSSLKIHVWIFILEILISQNILKHGIHYRKVNQVNCFILSCNKSKIIYNELNILNKYKIQRNNALLSLNRDINDVDLVNIDSPYLSKLNQNIKLLNKSISKNGEKVCFDDLKYVLKLFSNAISGLYLEPVEMDLKSKLNEINTNVGTILKLPIDYNNINPILAIKMYPPHKVKPELSYDYLTVNEVNGKVTYGLFRRELNREVLPGIKKQIATAFKEFSRTLGNFFSKFYTSELPFDDLIKEAIRLGLRGTVELFEGLSLLELTANTHKGYKGLCSKLRETLDVDYKDLVDDQSNSFNSGSRDNLFNALALIDYYYNFDDVRSRFYSKLIGHYFRLKDPESILIIFNHLLKSKDKKINSIYLTQYLVSLSHEFQKRIDSINKGKELVGGIKNQDYIESVISGYTDNELVTSRVKQLYLELKNKVKNVFELYKENHLNPFNITHELAEIIEKNYSNVVPGLFRETLVSPDVGISGTCESCNSKIRFQDISESDRFDLFLKLISTIYSTSPNELVDLYEFYKFLLKAKESGNPYTCVIDGQNIGYSKNIIRFLSWFKIYYSYTLMKSFGENVLIVIPQGSVRYISAYLQRKDPLKLNLLNQMMENKAIYKTKKNSYDDNFFLLAGISTFSKREMELFNKYISSITTDELSNTTSLKDIDSHQVNKDDVVNVNEIDSERGDNVGDVDSSNNNCDTRNNKNVIVLTNDKLSNLNIENVNQNVLERWKDYSLINYKIIKISNREMFIVGNRLKYTFSIFAEDNIIHIPIGYDRIFTNISESLKCTFEWRNEMKSTCFNINLNNNEDTPIKKWIKNNCEYLYNINNSYKSNDGGNGPYTDDFSNAVNNGCNKHGKNDLNGVNSNYYTRNIDVVHHRSPEIAKLMFSPTDKSVWLCIDMNSFDRTISNL